MATVTRIHAGGDRPEDSLSFLQEVIANVDEGDAMKGVVVFSVTKDGHVRGGQFGRLTDPEVAYLAVLIQTWVLNNVRRD